MRSNTTIRCIGAAAAVTLLVSACGGSSAHTATSTTRAAVPDVRGMNAPDAVVRLVKARYCVQLKLGARVPVTRRFPVESQAPQAGSTGRLWSTVTLTIGVPTAAGVPRSRSYTVGIDVWGGGRVPCPRIRTIGS